MVGILHATICRFMPLEVPSARVYPRPFRSPAECHLSVASAQPSGTVGEEGGMWIVSAACADKERG